MAPKRKGGAKGFLKSAARAGAEPSDDGAPEETPTATPPLEAAQSKEDAAPAAPQEEVSTPLTAAHPVNGSSAAKELSDAPDESEPGGGGGEETRGQMLQRHKRVLALRQSSLSAKTSSVLQRDSGIELPSSPQEAKASKDTAKKMGKKRKVGVMELRAHSPL